MLTLDQEVSLARRWRAHGDLAAAQALVTSHLRLVAKIAVGFRGYGLPLGDLIAEGNIGLMLAAQRFDPERGFRLATYAMWWIRAGIQHYILANWSLVRLGTTRAQKKLFFNLRKLKSRLHALEDGDLPAEAVRKISTELGVSEAEVVTINRRLAGADYSLNMPFSADGEGEWQDRLVDQTDDQERALAHRQELGQRSRLLDGAMRLLSDRERHIVSERHLREEPASLEVLSQRHHLSRERVRQIETSALAKLRNAVKRLAETDVVPAGSAAARPADGAHPLPVWLQPVPSFNRSAAVPSHRA
jgi:RNA polymerase sigma-32 factor